MPSTNNARLTQATPATRRVVSTRFEFVDWDNTTGQAKAGNNIVDCASEADAQARGLAWQWLWIPVIERVTTYDDGTESRTAVDKMSGRRLPGTVITTDPAADNVKLARKFADLLKEAREAGQMLESIVRAIVTDPDMEAACAAVGIKYHGPDAPDAPAPVAPQPTPKPAPRGAQAQANAQAKQATQARLAAAEKARQAQAQAQADMADDDVDDDDDAVDILA